MSGILELEVLLKNMQPEISENDYVFCTFPNMRLEDAGKYNPIGIFKEEEGLTLILDKTIAEREKFKFDGVFRQITLQVHSSLEAVGLTAAVSRALTNNGISANMIAAYYHDHIFVPKDKSKIALEVLQSLSQSQ